MSNGNPDGLPPEIREEMDAAIRRVTIEVAEEHRAHLNAVADAVFVSHRGRSHDLVLVALISGAATAGYYPRAATMRPAAHAISAGRRFRFV